MTEFKVTLADDKEVELHFADPNAKTLTEATKIYNTTFAKGLEEGGLLRKKLAGYLQDQGLWDDAKQLKLDTIQREITEKEHRLHKGGISLSNAKALALEISKDRNEQAVLLTAYNEYDKVTIEGQSDNARFNYLVFASTVYKDTGKRYFKSYDDFATYKDPVAFIAATKYAKEYYDLDEDFESSLPENKFLKQYGFIDDKLRLVNKDGHLIDRAGKLVDENGNLVDEEGNLIDIYGYQRNDDGTFADAPAPFLDDDGEPVVVDSAVNSEEVANS